MNQINAGQIGPIRQIGNGVWTAEALTPSGEKMYFAMETLENGDKDKWELYKNIAACLVSGGVGGYTSGSLVELGSRVNDIGGLKAFLAKQKYPNYWTSDRSIFERLCVNLQERNIVFDSPKAKELSAIPHASNGLNVDYQTHMVYVSKLPVTSRINFTSNSWDFSGYVEKYGDLIMTVGVTISNFVENRGIFRNPLSVVEGGYAGISMMTHSFTCMAVENNWPEVKTFRVRPLKKMGELFLNSLPKDQVTVNGIRGDRYDKGFESEQDVRVPVAVLANLHRAR